MPTAIQPSDAVALGPTAQLDDVKVTLLPGQRIGLLGPNGAGKSTLIKSLTGDLPLLAGRRVPGEHLAIGYFAQHQLEGLDLASTPFQHVQRLSPTAADLDIRKFLGGFGFHGDDVFAEVGRFSGGEKARLALSLVAWQKPNLLLLDEPTNHLDADAVVWLERHLDAYEGTVISITHDRYFLDNVAQWMLEMHDGKAYPYQGNYSVYLEKRRSREKSELDPLWSRLQCASGKRLLQWKA